jgi:hypothetical protein
MQTPSPAPEGQPSEPSKPFVIGGRLKGASIVVWKKSQDAATPGAESANLATESVAEFKHHPIKKYPETDYPNQTWFLSGSGASGVEDVEVMYDTNRPRKISIKIRLGLWENASIERELSADQCESLSRHLIDAAYHLRSLGEVAA